MSTQKFEVTFMTEGGEHVDSGVIELDQKVIDAVNDEWRDSLYDLHTPEEIAAHVGFNCFVGNWPLTSMDGWADLDNSMLKVVKYPTLDAFEVTAKKMPKEVDEELGW